MIIFVQETGEILRDSEHLGYGYSGKGVGKNNPMMQRVPNVGPLPQGTYLIGDPFDSDKHGPFVLPLVPDPTNQMFGRSEFLIHGDSIAHPGSASEGCIIASHLIRTAIYRSGDHLLKVICGEVKGQ